MTTVTLASNAAVEPVGPSGDDRSAAMAARIDRLPADRWLVGLAVAGGFAFLIDGFDTATLAYVAPVIRKAWHISPLALGALIAGGYGGQVIGAVASGFLAERIGRAKAAFLAIAIASLFSLICATANGYTTLVLARVAQGLGLGGLLPIVLIYINEMTPSRVRGRINFLVTTGFGIGIFTSTAVASFVVPAYGWRSLFLVGGGPLLVLPFAWRYLPESLPWLSRKGIVDKADRLLRAVEMRAAGRGMILSRRDGQAVPSSPPGVVEHPAGAAVFFTRGNIKRLALVIALGVGSVIPSYGVSNWLPTILTADYGVPVGLAIKFSMSVSAAGLVAIFSYAAIIDRFNHLGVLSWVSICGSLPLFAVFLLASRDASTVAALSAVSYLGILIGSPGASLLTAEIFAPEFRARAMGILSASTRLAILISPLLVGFVLGQFGASVVFVVLAGIAAGSGIIVRIMKATL